MKDIRDYSLLRHNTFGIDAKCSRFLEYTDETEARQVASILREEGLPFLIVGGGSNLLLTRDFEGIKKLRNLSFEDLDAAMALGLKMSLEEIRARGAEPFRDTVDACAYYSRLQAIKEEEKTC